MRILVTNDDGVNASGLLPLVRWCMKLGEVTTVVPKFEQSGKAHGIELHVPYEAKEVELAPGIRAWAVDSTPADCVRFAVMGLHKEFDLVVSGINRGFNIGSDQCYSGTVGAACEAVLSGIPALAFSTSPAYYEEAHKHLDLIYEYIQTNHLMDYNPIYNINIPPNNGEFRITRQGGPYFSDDYVPIGNDMYKAQGKCVFEDDGDLTLDTVATMRGYISISPLTVSMTNMDIFRKLSK